MRGKDAENSPGSLDLEAPVFSPFGLISRHQAHDLRYKPQVSEKVSENKQKVLIVQKKLESKSAISNEKEKDVQYLSFFGWVQIKISSAHVTTSPPLSTCPANVQIKPLNQNAHEHVEVFGIDMNNFSRSHQYIICSACVLFFLLIYGYLQEKIVVHTFDRKFSSFVSFLQFGGYTFLCGMQRLLKRQNCKLVPLKNYFTLALLSAASQAFSNLGIQLLNYPAKVIFKSSKIIPTMLVGIAFYNKRYPLRDWLVCLFIVAGLITFLIADAKSAPNFDPRGVLYLSAGLLADSVNGNFQEYTMKKYKASLEEFVYYTYLVSTLVMLSVSVFLGEFTDGLQFARTSAWKVWFEIFAYSGAGFIGVTYTVAITKHFGAFASNITSTMRKACTFWLSFVMFPKPITLTHAFGALIFGIGLVLKSFGSQKQNNAPIHGSGTGLESIYRNRTLGNLSLKSNSTFACTSEQLSRDLEMVTV